jgi:hypothetical protein
LAKSNPKKNIYIYSNLQKEKKSPKVSQSFSKKGEILPEKTDTGPE